VHGCPPGCRCEHRHSRQAGCVRANAAGETGFVQLENSIPISRPNQPVAFVVWIAQAILSHLNARPAGLLDVAHAAVHLHAEGSDLRHRVEPAGSAIGCARGLDGSSVGQNGAHAQISVAAPPDLPPRSLMVADFAITCSLVRPGRPLYPVLVHRAAALLHASFRPHLAMTALALR
jgi:hypothetical protein